MLQLSGGLRSSPGKPRQKTARCYREKFKELCFALYKAESIPTRIHSRCVPRSEEEKNCGFVT